MSNLLLSAGALDLLAEFRPLRIPAQDEALRGPIRDFLKQALLGKTDLQLARSWSGYDPEFSRALGQRGWLGLTLPVSHGGGGRSAFARYVLVEELLASGAPVGCHWIADRQSAPLILKFGSEIQKQKHVPAICRGEQFFCIGMSEPNSGSDLASVRTRADWKSGQWVLNGQKVWTTNAHGSHFMIALARSSGGPEDRQKGLSQFIVDLSLPGVSVRPIQDLSGDRHFCEVFFDNVALGPEALIGEEGQGWSQVNAELAFERSGPERWLSSIVLFDAWRRYIVSEDLIDDASRLLAGLVLSRLGAIRGLSLSVTGQLNQGQSPVVQAALVKDLGTGVEQDIPLLIADDLATRQALGINPPQLLWDTLHYVTCVAPSFSLRGGTREILRGMIARGLGLR
jgi:hypothetical protein